MKVKYSHILMWLLIISPIIDNINGFLLLNGHSSSISTLFKTFILIVCFVMLGAISINKTFMVNIIVSLIFFIQIFSFEMQHSGNFAFDFTTIIKLLLPLNIGFTFISLYQYDKEVPMIIQKLARFYCWFFPISLLIPNVLGVGYATYQYSGIGNKGFYYAGNEISSIMVLIFAIALNNYMCDKRKAQLFNILILILSIFMISTKTSYIIIFVEILTAFILNKNMKRRKKTLILSGFVFIAICVLWFNWDKFNIVLESWKWSYQNRYKNPVSFLLNGRNNTLASVFQQVYQEHGVIKVLWGIGAGYANQVLGRAIEMDFFDLFVWFGLCGVICITVLYSYFVKKLIKTSDWFGIVTIFLMFANSFLAGHVLCQPMVSNILIVTILYFVFQGRNGGIAIERKRGVEE